MPTHTLPSRIDVSNRRISGDEADLIRHLDAMREEGERWRNHWAKKDDVSRDLRLYRGEVGPRNRSPHFTANFIEAFIDRMTSQLTDNRPILRVEQRKSGLRNVAAIAEKVIQAVWSESNVQRRTFKMVHNAAVTRSAGIYTDYNPALDIIDLEVLKLSQVLISPNIFEAADLDRRAEYVFIDRVKPVDEIALLFPGRGAEVKPDSSYSDLYPEDPKKTILSPLSELLTRRRNGGTIAVPRSKITEIWVRDLQRLPDGRAAFPGGRRIIRTADLLLYDGPNHFWDGLMPIDWYDWRVDPDSPWGRSEPDRLHRMQLSFNELVDGLIENQLLSNFIQVVADFDSVSPETWKQLQNLSSTLLVRKTNRNATFSIVPPAPFGADKIALARQLFTFAQLLTGVTDVTLGETPGSLQSGEAIEGLQEGANLMTRSRASRLEDLFERVGTKLLSRIFQFMPSDRVISLVGPTGEAIEYAIKRREFFLNDDNKAIEGEERTRALRDLRFCVSPGSSSPGSRMRRGELAIRLVESRMMSRVDALKTMDFPEPEAMIRRVDEEFAQLAPQIDAMKLVRGGGRQQ